VIGILVDAVNAVLDIAASEIEAPPTFGAQVRAEMLQGIGKVQGRFVLLLNVQHVVSGSDLALLASNGVTPADALPALSA
jgi:purine-binding chemotaxis protein CheW